MRKQKEYFTFYLHLICPSSLQNMLHGEEMITVFYISFTAQLPIFNTLEVRVSEANKHVTSHLQRAETSEYPGPTNMKLQARMSLRARPVVFQ